MEGLGGDSQRINRVCFFFFKKNLFIESEGPVNPVNPENITPALKNQPRSGTTMLAGQREKQLPTDTNCNHFMNVPFVDGVMLGVCNMYFI